MKRKIKNSQEGVVGIVVSILLIGLITSVVSLVQTVYVPKWMEQKEAEHMDVILSQFSQLKSSIDTQITNHQPDTPITTSVTLGSKELPYLMSVRSFGQLQILPGSSITISNSTFSQTYQLGIIKYSSTNAYFIDQSYIYENGAIITSQAEGNMISIKPSFSIKNSAGTIILKLNVVNITGLGGKTIGSGFGTTSIQTEYYGKTTTTIEDVNQITITTQFPNAWITFTNWLLKKELTPDTDFTISLTDNDVTIQFINPLQVILEIGDIYAQIGAGWID